MTTPNDKPCRNCGQLKSEHTPVTQWCYRGSGEFYEPLDPTPPAPVATEKTAEELRADFDELMIQAKQDVADLKSGYTGKGGVRYAPVATEPCNTAGETAAQVNSAISMSLLVARGYEPNSVATERPAPEHDAEDKRRAEWLHSNGAPMNWAIVTVEEARAAANEYRAILRQRDELAERLAELEKKRAAESLQYSKNLALIAMRENDAQNALRAKLAESEAGRVQAEKERDEMHGYCITLTKEVDSMFEQGTKAERERDDTCADLTAARAELQEAQRERDEMKDTISRLKTVLGIDISEKDADRIVEKARGIRCSSAQTLDERDAAIARAETAERELAALREDRDRLKKLVGEEWSSDAADKLLTNVETLRADRDALAKALEIAERALIDAKSAVPFAHQVYAIDVALDALAAIRGGKQEGKG